MYSWLCVKVRWQLRKVQDIERPGDEAEDGGDIGRCGEAELRCGLGEMVSELVEEARLDFSPRSDFLPGSEFSLSKLSRRLVFG